MKKAGMFLANVFLCFIMACELRARGQRDRIPPAWTVNCVGQSAAKGLRGISEVCSVCAIGRFGWAGGPLTGYWVAFGLTSARALMTLLPTIAVAGVAALFIAVSVSAFDRAQAEAQRA
jgi:hypothetical protein